MQAQFSRTKPLKLNPLDLADCDLVFGAVTPDRRQKPRVPRSFANGCPGIVPVQCARLALNARNTKDAAISESVRQKFAQFRPDTVSEQPAAQLPIVRREGHESPAFLNQFVSGDSQRPVDKATAIYVAATITNEAIGRGFGNQAVVAFKNDPVTPSDVLAVIDRLCGGNPAGWQRLQRKAGVEPGSGA